MSSKVSALSSGHVRHGMRRSKSSVEMVEVHLHGFGEGLIAPLFLPPTCAEGGLAFERRLYFSDVNVPDLGVDLALLFTLGPLTMVRMLPSTKADALTFGAVGEISEVDGDTLVSGCRRVAAAALLAWFWAQPEARAALTSLLIRNRWTDEEVATFLDAITIAAGGEVDRLKSLSQAGITRERLARGERIDGLSKLNGLVGRDVALQASKWLVFKHCWSQRGRSTSGPRPWSGQTGRVYKRRAGREMTSRAAPSKGCGPCCSLRRHLTWLRGRSLSSSAPPRPPRGAHRGALGALRRLAASTTGTGICCAVGLGGLVATAARRPRTARRER